jgi:hypothetical protein
LAVELRPVMSACGTLRALVRHTDAFKLRRGFVTQGTSIVETRVIRLPRPVDL